MNDMMFTSCKHNLDTDIWVQETALNHVWMSGLLSDGFGATHGMMKHDLIWVVSRMQVQVDHYPIW